MKIAIDVMGGDYAPAEIIAGAKIFSQEDSQTELILIGNETVARELLGDFPNCHFVHTDEFIDMNEVPLQALKKKKNASVALSANLVASGEADACLSAGNTGALMAASLLSMGRIKGVVRPAIPVMLPTSSERGALLLDVGANSDCRSQHLYQFAVMGSHYYSKVYDIEKPRVGILSIGEEASKGNELTKNTYELFSNSPLNFVGNIEADRLFHSAADVVVCDGFVGNVLLKASEGVSGLIQKAIFSPATAAGLTKEILGNIKQQLKKFSPDSPEYSGAPLLGLNGVSIVCHGNSKALVIANAIKLAKEFVSTKVIDLIRTHFQQFPDDLTGLKNTNNKATE